MEIEMRLTMNQRNQFIADVMREFSVEKKQLPACANDAIATLVKAGWPAGKEVAK